MPAQQFAKNVGEGKRPLAALLIAWFLLVTYAASNSKQSAGQKRAAIAAALLVMLVLSFVGGFNQTIAVGFASLLLLSSLVAGPGNSFLYLTKTIPQNLVKTAGG